jgi:phenylpropionate dioxygenase-like ring-hydroxylating dioxygenase large terminal subunit
LNSATACRGPATSLCLLPFDFALFLQAIDAKAKAVACSSSRSCVTRYPTREEAGLIWVWPTPGPAAESAAAAQPVSISKAAASKFAEGGAGTWYRRELPYSWDVLVENLTDPCE